MELLRSIHGKNIYSKEVYEEIQAGLTEGYSLLDLQLKHVTALRTRQTLFFTILKDIAPL
jgi:hypothetical protein